jgi:hypothetical protein
VEPEKRKPGRLPAEHEYPHVRPARLGDEDLKALKALARKWCCSEAAAMRRAIQEPAERVISFAHLVDS